MGPRPPRSILIDFGSQHEAKLGPSLGQVGLRIGSILVCFSKLVLDSILHPLGVDFGHLLGSILEPKSELNKKGVETAKFDSRCSGSSILNVPRG